MDSKQLRTQIRHQRQQLSATTQQTHQQAVIQHLIASKILQQHHHIALYLHNNGELHTNEIIDLLFHLKKQLYLPRLTLSPEKKLLFLSFNKKKPLIKNRFHILEPHQNEEPISVHKLDIIFMPLVAFDQQGNRLGMGGGFYDRTLSDCKTQGQTKKPLLIGLAHELQKVDAIDAQDWDVPLDAIITEKRFTLFTKAFL